MRSPARIYDQKWGLDTDGQKDFKIQSKEQPMHKELY